MTDDNGATIYSGSLDILGSYSADGLKPKNMYHAIVYNEKNELVGEMDAWTAEVVVINVSYILEDGIDWLSWSAICPGSTENYEQLLVDGLKQWENNGDPYNIEGRKVVVKVNAKNRIRDKNYNDDDRDIVVTLVSKDESSFVRNPILWYKEKIFPMFEEILWHDTINGVVVPRYRTGWEFQWSAAHEFGHVLGLGDAYKSDEKGLKGAPAKPTNPTDSNSITEVPTYDVMNQNWDTLVTVTDNDVEMMLQALIENNWQYFADGDKGDNNKKSVVITSY